MDALKVLLLCLLCSISSPCVSSQGTLNVEATQGETITLPCSASSDVTLVTWHKENQPNPLTVGEYVFVADSRYAVIRDNDVEWALVIRDVTVQDSGDYVCESKHGQSSHTVTSVHLAVTEAAGEDDWRSDGYILSLRDIQQQLRLRSAGINKQAAPVILEGVSGTVFKGRTADVTLTCHVTGNPLPQVYWVNPAGHIMRSAVNNKSYTTTQVEADQWTVTSTLHVNNLQTNDFGYYKCEAANDLGFQKRYVKVTRGEGR